MKIHRMVSTSLKYYLAFILKYNLLFSWVNIFSLIPYESS